MEKRIYRLACLAALALWSAPARAVVTDFFIVLPKAEGEKPKARVMDDQDGIQTYDLGESFDEADKQGGHWHSAVTWRGWQRGRALSYVAIKGSRRDGDPNAPEWCVFKRVGEDGKESWRLGPFRLRPLAVSAGCERVACGRAQGQEALETLDALEVFDARGKPVWQLLKPGLGAHLALSPGGRQLAYIDGLDLVVRDLDAGTETRDPLANVRNVTGTHDVRWISGLKDDGTVVFMVQMLGATTTDGGQFSRGAVLESHFRHGDDKD